MELTLTFPVNKWTRKEFMSKLFSEYNRLKAFARKNPQMIDEVRLNRALGIMQSKTYWEAMMAEYQPTIEECSCKDEVFHNRQHRLDKGRGKYVGPCKHRIALQIHKAIGGKL
jgi:hypothetical protein